MAGNGAASVRDHRAETQSWESQRCSTLAKRGIRMVSTPDLSGEDLFMSPSVDMSVHKSNPQVPDHRKVAEVWMEDSLLLPSGVGGYRKSHSEVKMDPKLVQATFARARCVTGQELSMYAVVS